MNPEKAQIKIALLHQQGSQWDDWLEAKERQKTEMSGAVTVLRQARDKIIAPIMAAVREDADKGVLGNLQGLQLQAYVFKQLDRVELALENMQMNAERERMVAEGRIAQMRDVVEITKKAFDEEKTALALHQQAVASGEKDVMGRPTLSAADDIAQRKADAKAEKEKPPEVVVEPVAVKAPKKRTGRGG